jgi:peptidoglycan/xylan/chitin deacetylase (PgdA/CDA1 family)
MYHLVGDPPASARYPDLYVSAADFTAQMLALSDGGWHTITAAELGADMAADRPVPERTIVLTFDDGNVDNFTTAFPILQRFGFRATFYMVADGGGSRMTVPELATMAQAGMEIANHTMDHRNVARLSTANLRLQVAGAELRIESELAGQGVVTGVRTFAYPSGHLSATAEAYLAGRGYTAAFTEGPGVVTIGSTNPLQAPRLRVSRFLTLADFLAQLPAERIQ